MAVCDASVLLAFCILDKTDVLAKLSGKVIAPYAVKTEVTEALRILAPDKSFPDEKTVEVVFLDVTDPAMPQSEAETLELAAQRKSKIVLSDDALLRKAAAEKGYMIAGTAGLLYAARRKGLIADVGAAIETLRGAGYTFSDSVRIELERRAAT